MKKTIKRKIRNMIKLVFKSIQRPSLTVDYIKLCLISNIKRYETSTTNILKNLLTFVDSASFVSMYEEIFCKEIYKFKSTSIKPYIIDGGANIGLSVLYFKKLYPNSEVIAFEPDKKIVDVLEKNIKSFKLSNVEIINKGLWNKEEKLSFFSEGADGGRIKTGDIMEKENSISTLSLRPFLSRKVDFLKIDIEGAETVVLEDCKNLLMNVENLFVEYHSFNKNNQTLDKILEIISNSGFRYYIESVGVSSRFPFISRESNINIDLQLNIYGYRD